MYFGNKSNTVTTLLLLGLLVYMGALITRRYSVSHWGWHMLFLSVLGLTICCFAAGRDGLHLTIQNAIDGSCTPGIFRLISFPTIAGCIGAFIIIVSQILALFLRDPKSREVLCFVMMGGIIEKIVLIEISRFRV